MSDIVKRLKEACVIDRYYGKSVTLTLDYDDYMEAADTITALRAENEKLRAALRSLEAAAIKHHQENVVRAEWGGSDTAHRKAKAVLSRSGVLLSLIRSTAREALGGKDE